MLDLWTVFRETKLGFYCWILLVERGSRLWRIHRRGLTYIYASSKLPFSVSAGFKNEVGVCRPRENRADPSVSASSDREEIIGKHVIESPLHQALTSLHSIVSNGEIIAGAPLHAPENGHLCYCFS
jgi:hypothetical protein